MVCTCILKLILCYIVDVDECERINNGGCLNGATCVNAVSGFSCECTSGYLGQQCTLCKAIFTNK